MEEDGTSKYTAANSTLVLYFCFVVLDSYLLPMVLLRTNNLSEGVCRSLLILPLVLHILFWLILAMNSVV